MYEKVKRVIETKINPALLLEGGKVELVSVEKGVVNIRLLGACAGCPMRSLTVTNFIEAELKKEVPEIEKIAIV
jgi:Fe-S cluster biogenesis protein NfuA